MEKTYTDLLGQLSDKGVDELKNHNPLIASILEPAIGKSLNKMSEKEAKDFILYTKDLLITECAKIK